MDREKELRYLDNVESVIEQKITALEKHLNKSGTVIVESKQELWQNLTDMDPEEISAMTRSIEDDTILHDVNHATLQTLYRQKGTPYFGRVDFKMGQTVRECYIGLAHLRDDKTSNILVLDWRAPISSLYYNHELGPASFQAPVGEIKGEIVGKYQYKIVDGQMQYMFDSSLTIQDEILQMTLSSNSSDKMRNIVSTIQQEQNQIIRADGSKTLIVQGVAGSGKTSVALHRVAYLLYQYKDSIKSENILIISPSKMFSTYIANVLPELGEDSILELSMTEIAEKELSKEFKLTSHYDYLDACFVDDADDREAIASSLHFKATSKFVNAMTEYVEKRASQIFHPHNFFFGSVSMTAEELSELYKQYNTHAPLERIKLIENLIEERMRNLDEDRKVPTKEQKDKIAFILKSYTKCGTLLEEYNNFLSGLTNMGFTAGASIGKVVPFEDVFPLLLFKFKFEGVPNYRFVKHLLIDEMQDYTPVQYEILNMMFSCPKTILGDINQIVDPYTNIGSLNTLRKIYKNDGVFLELNTSYRSSCEIAEVAKSILGKVNFGVVARHNDKPVLVKCNNATHQVMAIARDIKNLSQQGYFSIAIICKTKKEALKTWKQLSPYVNTELLIDANRTYRTGCVITTCAVSKGLEFDCVIIPNCNDTNYSKSLYRKPLYVMATRALHQLHFYCLEGQIAPYLQSAVQRGQLVLKQA